jgi:hypothetical protein
MDAWLTRSVAWTQALFGWKISDLPEFGNQMNFAKE